MCVKFCKVQWFAGSGLDCIGLLVIRHIPNTYFVKKFASWHPVAPVKMLMFDACSCFF